MTYLAARQISSKGSTGKAEVMPGVEVGTRVTVQHAASSPISRQRISHVRTKVLPKVGRLAQAALARFGHGENTGPRNVRTGTKTLGMKK